MQAYTTQQQSGYWGRVGLAIGGLGRPLPNAAFCPHDDCPICAAKKAEEDRIAREHAERAGEVKRKREQDYKKRCAEYLTWFRQKKAPEP